MNKKQKYNPNIHNRQSIRLKGYDYSQAGLYFITICCQNRACLFGKVTPGSENSLHKLELNDAGIIANTCWLEIPKHYPNAVLHEFVIMPNHIHGIIELINDTPVGAENLPPDNNNGENEYKRANNLPPDNNNEENEYKRANNYSPRQSPDYSPSQSSPPQSPSRTIGAIVRGFKIGVTKWMRQHTNIYDVWQRNYYERIIRKENAYQAITNYIRNNPAKWARDKLKYDEIQKKRK